MSIRKYSRGAVRGSGVKMSDDESFLARWARRKRGAAATTPRSAKPKNAADSVASKMPATALPTEETRSLFDPESLPPIDSIDTGSDIRPFLTAGVPAELTRAALRRAWSADPGIRDFIGLSENSWDFNALDGVPGFGSLTAEEARRLLARVMDATKSPTAEPLSHDHVAKPPSEACAQASSSVPAQVKAIGHTDADHHNPMLHPKASNIAAQHEKGKGEPGSLLPRRGHGGALPD
jgi:Protein of unknown function (DUF3306)